MVENVEQENVVNAKNSKSYKTIFVLFVLLAACGAGAYAWYQNNGFSNIFKSVDEESALVSNLQSQIQELNLRVKSLEQAPKAEVSTADLAMLNDKINTSLNFNEQILDAKANTSSVLGLINRVDALEHKVNALGQVSSQGALVLTAAMLVKDSAYKGEFTYEAEVLKYLSLDTAMARPAEEIYQYASVGILCKRKLIDKFNELYQNLQNTPKTEENVEQIVDQEEPTTWKEKINSKIKELVIIEKHQENEPEAVESKTIDEVYKLVNDGYLSLALEKMKSNELYNTEEFKIWEQQVIASDKFEQALKQIEVLTLAFMKTEALQNR